MDRFDIIIGLYIKLDVEEKGENIVEGGEYDILKEWLSIRG